MMNALLHIGRVRRALLLPGSWKWNAWMRDWTAMVELRCPWLIGS